MKKLLILLIMSYSINIVYAIPPKSIRKDIVDFLLKRRELPQQSNDLNYKNCIRIFNLATDQQIKNPTVGIFRFCTCSAHTKFYIVIAENNQVQILTLQFLDQDLMKIISYAQKKDMSSDIILVYIKNAILLYQWNVRIDRISE